MSTAGREPPFREKVAGSDPREVREDGTAPYLLRPTSVQTGVGRVTDQMAARQSGGEKPTNHASRPSFVVRSSREDALDAARPGARRRPSFHRARPGAS